jgi:transposase
VNTTIGMKEVLLNPPNREFRKLVETLRDPELKKEVYQAQETREIDWSAYTLSQIKEVEETLNFIRESVNGCKIHFGRKVGKPLTNPKYLAKAVLLSEFLKSPERVGEGWSKILGPYVGIHKKIDDRVLGEAYARPEVTIILYEIFLATKDSDRRLNGDGTGLERTRKQNYESNKTRGTYMTSIVDSREIVQAFDISGKHECKVMHELVKEVIGDSLRLDAGFNDRELVDLIESLGMVPYVFPKKINKLNGHPAWKFMYIELFLDVYEWLKEYHQRSHIESFHSAFKRVYGIITKIRYQARLTQITARIILHNFRRLSYFRRVDK